MKDARVIVTGATSGIGAQIAVDLAARGAHVVIACRDVSKGRRVADTIGRERATVMYVDTSSQRSIRDFAAAYRAAHDRLDVLVNNAGTAQDKRLLSVDGIELTFATNVLGYYLVTTELLPVITASAPARIVVVASAFASDLDLDDLQFETRPYESLRAYAQSKACNRLFSWALARRLEGTGVTVNAMTPGFVPGTGLSRELSPELRRSYQLRTGRSIEQGADTATWLASASEIAGVSGRFWSDRQEQPCEFRNTRDEERLWEICDRLTHAPAV